MVSYNVAWSWQRWLSKQEEYLRARAEWDLSEHLPTEKPPKRPSIFSYILFEVSKRSLLVNIVWYLVSNALYLIMPLIMKLLLQDIAKKETNPTFPFASGIVQIVVPYIQGLADGVVYRLFIHRTLSVRGMLNSSTKSRSNVFTDVCLQIPTGSLTMVVGGIESGKSSLAAAFTGDVGRVNRTVCLRGSIADVVRVCALEKDLQTLAAGDSTAIGEKGVNLSGGQKARIQLARAVSVSKNIHNDPRSSLPFYRFRIVNTHFFIQIVIISRMKKRQSDVSTRKQLWGCQVDQHGVKEHAGQFCSGSCRAEKKNNQKFSDFVTNARQERSLSKKGVNAGLVRTVGRSTAEKSLFTTISDQLDTDAPEPLVPRQAEQHPLVKHKYKPNATTAIDKKSARSLNISNDITAR
ncbi:hypothetical protein BLNAU_4907 [Blattamonas nauphoetae]|uniref:ABC transmembrane type-1 domain-containing protein n=1 Tax=Blattamonas nauphoetae TaxID=2049346 RepID=A0ABQ9Y8J4_9EUKA|nr:hypothetical protein BLNAU_4907 [Blattamonas nauphoetae]